MKKIFLILSILFTLNSFSQTYYPFPDSVGIWRQSSSYTLSPGIQPNALFLDGDTIINNKSYNKLFRSHNTYNIDTNNSLYYGAIREVNKKIYFHPNSIFNLIFVYPFCNVAPIDFNDEFLLYDYDVTIGDTVFYPTFDSTYIVITSIDSILIQNQFRKQYNYTPSSSQLCNYGSNNSYVEGIGDINSGLIIHWIFSNWIEESLNCFEDDEVFYSNVTDCATVGIEEEKTELEVKTYPNPVSEKLFIEFSDVNQNEPIEISFFDISGKKVYSSSLNQSESIDVSNFKKGLYLLKIQTTNGQSKSKLISIY